MTLDELKKAKHDLDMLAYRAEGALEALHDMGLIPAGNKESIGELVTQFRALRRRIAEG